jgi:hypothetical protein
MASNTVLTLEGFTRESVQPLLKVMDSVRNTEMTDRAMEGRHSTSGWTTYVNEGSQYAFRYPDGGIVSQSESRSDDCITLSASEWTMTVNANALYDTSCGDRYSSGSEQTATPLILQADHRHMAGYQISVRPFEEEEKVHYASFRHAVDDDRTMLFVLEGTGSSVAEKNANFDRHQAEMFAVLETFVNLRTWSTYSDPAYPVTFQVPSGWQVKPAKNTAAMPGLETPFSELAFTEIAREQGPFGNSTCSLALFHRGLDTLAQLVETRIPGISETYPNREVNQRMQYGNEVYSVEYANGMRTDLKSAALLRAGDAIVGFFRSDNPVGTILYNPPDHLNNCAIIEATLKVK